MPLLMLVMSWDDPLDQAQKNNRPVGDGELARFTKQVLVVVLVTALALAVWRLADLAVLLATPLTLLGLVVLEVLYAESTWVAPLKPGCSTPVQEISSPC